MLQVEIEDMEWNAEKQTFFFPCPCGDKFLITVVLFPVPCRCSAGKLGALEGNAAAERAERGTCTLSHSHHSPTRRTSF